jgi:hypothetical protein
MMYDQAVQLTVSSVNTILEDLPETDDEDDDEKQPKVAEGKLVDVSSNPPPSLSQIASGSPAAECSSNNRSRHPSDSTTAGGARPRQRPNRRERSPVVSFDESPAIVIVPTRQRSRSDATRFIKFRSPSSSFSSAPGEGKSGSTSTSSASAAGGGAGGGKMSWLRERRNSTAQKIAAALISDSLLLPPEEESSCVVGDEDVSKRECDDPKAAATRKKLLSGRFKSSAELKQDKPTKKMRPRTKSDKFDRTSRKKVAAEVSKTSAFDWPLGRLGKLRQKYTSVSRSASAVALTESRSLMGGGGGSSGGSSGSGSVGGGVGVGGGLKRRHSERNKSRQSTSSRSVAFEEPGFATSLWKSSVKFILDKAKSSNRRRHFTDPDCKDLRQTYDARRHSHIHI